MNKLLIKYIFLLYNKKKTEMLSLKKGNDDNW